MGSVRTELESDDGLDMLDSFRPVVMEDARRFDGATPDQIRGAFKEWARVACETEQGVPYKRAERAYSARYRLCVMVDEEALQSVLDIPTEDLEAYNTTGFVILINGRWPPEWDPEELAAGGGPDDGHEPVYGCTLDEVGWMKVRYALSIDGHRPLVFTFERRPVPTPERCIFWTSTVSELVDGMNNIRTDTVTVSSVFRDDYDSSWGQMTVNHDGDWQFWGVYDGRDGWEASSTLRDYLAGYVNRKLDELPTKELGNPAAIEKAMESEFTELDDEIISDGLAAFDKPFSYPQAIFRAGPAMSESCALMALYDPGRATLHVAGTGDSRAVFGSRQHDSEEKAWTATLLSVEHTCLNPDERARIEKEHPGEDMFLSDGLFLSGKLTRSFGDNRRKWPVEALEVLKRGLFEYVYDPNISTPPYTTAKPDVKSTQVQPGDCLILGTNGFWDHMSSEDAVHCLGLWLESRAESDPETAELTQDFQWSSLIPDAPDKSPEPAGKATVEDMTPVASHLQLLAKKPVRRGFSRSWMMKPEDFVVEQSNVATHLVRNAFGGKDDDLFCTLMNLPFPRSKDYRDDVTVIVVLF